MSAYGKPPPPLIHGNGYDTGRSYPEGTFAYPAPIYGQSSANSSTSSPAFPNVTPLTQMAYPPNQPRTPYDEQAGPYLNVGSTPTPVVKDFSPHRGTRGTKFQVTVTTLYELLAPNEPLFFIVFGQMKVQGGLARTGQQGSICQYTIDADVPQLAATGYVSSQIPVSMYMQSTDGDVIAKVDVGTFTYVDPSAHGSAPQEVSRKRKLSVESGELMEQPSKRHSGHQIRPKEEYSPYGYASSDTSSYASYLQPSPLQSTHYSVMPQPQYNSRPIANYSSQRNVGYPYSNSNSPPTLKVQSPQVGSWGSSYPSLASSMVRGPGLPSSTSMSRPGSLPSPALSANPPLIRTSTLQQTPSPAATPHGGAPHYNSYNLYPHRAKLEIKGDLDAMAVNWTPEEWEAKRRLVLFRRSQSGSTITTTFSPVSADERPPNSICISCIVWEREWDKEKPQDFFVTSVDTISLLEQLVAARFTVEEKNRIRRNLEGFRPQTVSKAKPESEEFFKLIMGFPPPKPRNIEKDVKVFNWKDLTSALKKIIGKYSASPSSTLPAVPALMTPVSSTGYPESSAAPLPYAGAVSPRSISTSTAYNANSNMHARLSPHNQKSMVQAGTSDGRVAMPHPHESSSWQSGQHPMHGSQYQQPQPQQQLGQNARGWDITANYIDSPSTTGIPTPQSHTLNYQAPRNADTSDLQNDNDRRLSSSRQQSQQVRRP